MINLYSANAKKNRRSVEVKCSNLFHKQQQKLRLSRINLKNQKQLREKKQYRAGSCLYLYVPQRDTTGPSTAHGRATSSCLHLDGVTISHLCRVSYALTESIVVVVVVVGRRRAPLVEKNHQHHQLLLHSAAFTCSDLRELQRVLQAEIPDPQLRTCTGFPRVLMMSAKNILNF